MADIALEKFVNEYLLAFPGGEILYNYRLSEHTTMRVGGEADIAVIPKNADMLCFAVKLCVDLGIKYTVIGRGSNIVCRDDGYRGVIIETGKLSAISVNGNEIYADAGASLNALSKTALDNALSGVEFAFGIPGSVGGAAYMNAGAYGGQIADVLASCTVYDPLDDKKYVYNNSACAYSYRNSVFMHKDHLIILSCRFILETKNKEDISAVMNANIAARRSKQPLEYPSSGSFFKRCEGYFTAKLIDDAGLKGYSVGGAQVSEKHAGFIINKGSATAADIMELASHVQTVINEKFGVEIEREVEYLG